MSSIDDSEILTIDLSDLAPTKSTSSNSHKKSSRSARLIEVKQETANYNPNQGSDDDGDDDVLVVNVLNSRTTRESILKHWREYNPSQIVKLMIMNVKANIPMQLLRSLYL